MDISDIIAAAVAASKQGPLAGVVLHRRYLAKIEFRTSDPIARAKIQAVEIRSVGFWIDFQMTEPFRMFTSSTELHEFLARNRPKRKSGEHFRPGLFRDRNIWEACA